jgi:hypothetical protein
MQECTTLNLKKSFFHNNMCHSMLNHSYLKATETPLAILVWMPRGFDLFPFRISFPFFLFWPLFRILNLKVSCSVGSNCIPPEEQDLLEETITLLPELSIVSSNGKEEVKWQNRLHHPKHSSGYGSVIFISLICWTFTIYFVGWKVYCHVPPIGISIPVYPDRVSEVRNRRDNDYLTRLRWKIFKQKVHIESWIPIFLIENVLIYSF